MFVIKSQLYFKQANVDMHHHANKPLSVFERALLEVELWKMRGMGIPPQKNGFNPNISHKNTCGFGIPCTWILVLHFSNGRSHVYVAREEVGTLIVKGNKIRHLIGNRSQNNDYDYG